MRARLRDAGLDGVTIESAGTGDWHIGNAPDPRAINAAKARGIDISGLKARQVTRHDFDQYDLVVAMDGANLADLDAIAPANARARLALMSDFATHHKGDVRDPYFGGAEGFETMLDMLEDACAGLIAVIKKV